MSASTPASPPSVPTTARPRRWPRRLLWTFAGLALLVAAAPLYVGALARPFVVDALERELAARCTLDGLSFSWPAHLRLTGLDLVDPQGAPLASLDALEGSLELAPLLTGELRATLAIHYPELHLALGPDGRWNWEVALEKALAAPTQPEPEDEKDERELPRVALSLEVADGHVIVHGREGETTLADIALGLELEGLDRPAPYRLGFGLRGPAGPAGRVRLEGDFTAAVHGVLEPAGLAAHARLALESLDLSACQPAAALVAPVTDLRGTAEGTLELELGEGLALTGTSDLTLRGLELVGPLAGGTPTRLESVRLAGSATQQGEGAGTQRLELAADDFLALVYEGSSNVPARGAGSLSGELTLRGDLARLAEVARGWVPLQEGVQVEGRLDQRLEIEATFSDRAPATLAVQLGGGLAGLAARDVGGRRIELGRLSEVTLALQARADLAAGTLSVSEASLGAGPVRFEGHLSARGVAPDAAPDSLVVERGDFHLVADLEALRGTLEALVALGEESFGGRLEARGTLAGSAREGLELELALEATELAFDGSSLERAQGRFQARRASDGALGGGGELTLGPGRLAGDTPLALPGLTLQLELAEDAGGQGSHRLGLRSAGGELTLELAAHSERRLERVGLTAELELGGDLAGLARLAGESTELPPGLAGRLTGRGTLAGEFVGGTLARASTELDFALKDLTVADATGAALALPALAETRLALAARLDGSQGRADVTNLALAAGGLTLTSRATVMGLDLAGEFRPAALEVHDGKLSLDLDLARLGPELAQVVDLGGATLGGTPLSLELDLAARAGRAEARGRLASTRLVYAPAEGAPLELAPLSGQFDLGLDLELGSLHVRTAYLQAGASSVTLAGTLNDLADPERARGTVTLDLAADLGRMLAELGLEPAESGRHTAGKLSGRFQLDGDQGAFRAVGTSTVEGFRLELAQEGEGVAPLVVEEPRIALALDARIAVANLDVELEKLTLDSGLARGGARGKILDLAALGTGEVRFEGLNGELAYVPDRLGAVLGPLLPGTWTGKDEQRATFRLDGRAQDFSLEEVLRSSTSRIDLELGHFVRPEVALDGTLALETREEKALLRGDLAANGGTLVIDGTLDLAQTKPRSRLTVTARDVKANSGLAPLLALAHPAFAASSLTRGSLEGLIGLTLDVTYDGPLALDQLQSGWTTLAKEPINGTGTLSLSGASLAGSPLLAALAEFGIDTSKGLDLKPIEFTIKKGRLSYSRPWTWTISGAETSFTGSVGLDQTLALDWNLPITPALVGRYDFLSILQGERITVPIRGTALAPRLDTGELLKDLAAKAGKKALEQKLGLGGGKDAQGEDPDTLLRRADELWSKGQKAEAARLYERIKEEFKLSLTYALNKDRIKDRAKYKP